jgi:hypothetical protein
VGDNTERLGSQRFAHGSAHVIVSGPANCQRCGEEAEFLYPQPQSAGQGPALNVCAKCRDELAEARK